MMTIRYLLYTDPSRQHTVQLGPDVESNDLPPNTYGKEILVEGQPYIIANIGHTLLIPCDDEEGSYQAVFQVLLARPEQWPEFGEPEIFRVIRQQKMKDNLDNRQN